MLVGQGTAMRACLCIKGARRHMKARDLVVQALISAVCCEGLNDCVHDLDASLPAGLPQACPDWANLLHPLPPVLHVWALQGAMHYSGTVMPLARSPIKQMYGHAACCSFVATERRCSRQWMRPAAAIILKPEPATPVTLQLHAVQAHRSEVGCFSA